MIRATRAWVDSEGAFHITREGAAKAEFRRLVETHFAVDLIHTTGPQDHPSVLVSDIVEAMFDIDKMIGEATREDSRVAFAAVEDVDVSS